MTPKPTLHSHTHCQVAQANTQAKTWQRVCLSNRTADRPTDDRKEQRRHNSTYPKGGVSYSADSFVVAESSVLRMKFRSEIPALRVAANRYAQAEERQRHSKLTMKMEY